MKRVLVNEKKGNILTGKSCIFAGIEVHDETADNKQPGDCKSYNNS